MMTTKMKMTNSQTRDKKEKIKFKDVKIHECFFTLKNDFCMKLSNLPNNSAISLEDGSVFDFFLDDEVFPIKAKVRW